MLLNAQVQHCERIEISEDARRVKDWFPERPGKEIVREVKKFIADGGEPHEWRGHTHTKPPPGSKPVYLEEFDLPKSRLDKKHWATCPCCSPDIPKYGHNGKIAWFPNEKIIRLLGPDCFKALDKEGHAAAKEQLRIERQRENDTNYLLSKLPLLGGVIKVAEIVHGVALATAEFRATLQAKLAAERLSLWDHVRSDGDLKITEKFEIFQPGLDGALNKRRSERQRTYAQLSGYEVLNPRQFHCPKRIRNCIETLQKFNLGDDECDGITSMSDQERHEAANQISRSVAALKECIAEIDNMRRFAEPVTINTLRNWARQEGCPMPRYWERRGDAIHFGRSEHSCLVVAIPRQMMIEIDPVEF